MTVWGTDVNASECARAFRQVTFYPFYLPLTRFSLIFCLACSVLLSPLIVIFYLLRLFYYKNKKKISKNSFFHFYFFPSSPSPHPLSLHFIVALLPLSTLNFLSFYLSPTIPPRVFIETFSIGTEFDAHYLKLFEVMHRVENYTLNLNLSHLYHNPGTRTLYGQLRKYPQEVIPIFDFVANDIYVK